MYVDLKFVFYQCLPMNVIKLLFLTFYFGDLSVRVYGCQNEGVFIIATKSLKKAVLNQKLRKTPKN